MSICDRFPPLIRAILLIDISACAEFQVGFVGNVLVSRVVGLKEYPLHLFIRHYIPINRGAAWSFLKKVMDIEYLV